MNSKGNFHKQELKAAAIKKRASAALSALPNRRACSSAYNRTMFKRARFSPDSFPQARNSTSNNNSNKNPKQSSQSKSQKQPTTSTTTPKLNSQHQQQQQRKSTRSNSSQSSSTSASTQPHHNHHNHHHHHHHHHQQQQQQHHHHYHYDKFDIDNMLIPSEMMHANYKLDPSLLRRAHVPTPKWRECCVEGLPEFEQEIEDLEDATFAKRHELAELRERYQMVFKRLERTTACVATASSAAAAAHHSLNPTLASREAVEREHDLAAMSLMEFKRLVLRLESEHNPHRRRLTSSSCHNNNSSMLASSAPSASGLKEALSLHRAGKPAPPPASQVVNSEFFIYIFFLN